MSLPLLLLSIGRGGVLAAAGAADIRPAHNSRCNGRHQQAARRVSGPHALHPECNGRCGVVVSTSTP